jgi:hypothetical protein
MPKIRKPTVHVKDTAPKYDSLDLGKMNGKRRILTGLASLTSAAEGVMPLPMAKTARV